jgi:hypothetical protein
VKDDLRAKGLETLDHPIEIGQISPFIMGQIGGESEILIEGNSPRFLGRIKGITLDNGAPMQQPKG